MQVSSQRRQDHVHLPPRAPATVGRGSGLALRQEFLVAWAQAEGDVSRVHRRSLFPLIKREILGAVAVECAEDAEGEKNDP